jgi:hypothetical protein
MPTVTPESRSLNSSSDPLSPSLQPAIAELERLFNALLPRILAAAGLPEAQAHETRPTIIIQRAGRRRGTLGWMAPQVWTCGESRRNEITLSAETLNRGGLGAFATLAHEMVHHGNQVRGVSDCSRNQYHNRAFKALAVAIGLVVEKDGHRGFAHTELGPDLLALAEAFRPDDAAFAIFRLRPAERPPISRMKKWTCACPKIFRAAVEHRAVCLDCERPYVRVEV